MINISQENIKKYKLSFKAGLYKVGSNQANLYNEKLEAEKQAILDARPYSEKRKEAFDNNPLTKIENLTVAVFEKMLADGTASTEMTEIETARKLIKTDIPKE